MERLDEEALLRVLERKKQTMVELLIRLAWQAGLTRRQITELAWNQVSFDTAEIRLPTHTVPIHPDLLDCLKERRNRSESQSSEYVVLTDALHTHPHEVVISRFLGAALDEEETLKDITFKDLRADFIIRALEQHGKTYAIRAAGISMGTLYMSYGQYLSQARENAIEISSSTDAEIDEEQLKAFLAAEGTSAAAIALWMNWKQGMTMEEIVSCTWQQVDFEKNVIRLADRESAMHPGVAQLLKEIRESRGEGEDPHVLLAPKSKKQFRSDRLYVVTRTALIKKGLDSLHLKTLSTLEDKKENEDKIVSYVKKNRFITRKKAASLLQTTDCISYNALARLIKSGKLVRVGARYYIPGTVVPPEEHQTVICDYLKSVGAVNRKEIANTLRIEARSCSWVLHKFVKEGIVVQRGQTYYLREDE